VSVRKRSRATTPAAHLIVGEDSYLRTQYRESVIAANVPEEARAFAVAQFSLARLPLADALAQAVTRPMLSPRQVLILGDVEALQEEDLANLEDYFDSPADFTVLIFEAEKLDRRTRAARLLLENCRLYEAQPPDDRGAVAAAAEFAQELSVKLDRETAEELVFVLGNDQGRLHAELRKLRAYVGEGGRVTPAAVEAVVSPARQFSVFDLADLLAERRRGDALARLRQLLEAGESPVGIVGLLAWLYRQLLQAQALPRNIPAWRAAQTLRAPRARVGALLQQARKFSPEELRAAFGILLEADVALKSSPANPMAVLEMMVVRLTGAQLEGEA
jgi:DNA polymerase-3 subunit delta